MIYVEIKYKKPDSKYKEGNIYYKLIYDEGVERINTQYKIFKWEWDEKLSEVVYSKEDNFRNIYLQFVERKIISEIRILLSVLKTYNESDVERVLSEFKRQLANTTFFNFMESVIKELVDNGQIKTAKGYRSAINSFSLFREGNDIEIEKIDNIIVKRYETFLKEKHLTLNTISFYMRILNAVYNRAVASNLTVNRAPFKGVYRGVDQTVKRAVSNNVIKKLKDIDLSFYKGLDFARDMFMFSFYARGMAFVDVANLKKENIKDNHILYRRKKTGQLLKIKIEPCIEQIIFRYESDSDYLFPVLDNRGNYANALRLQNQRLYRISELLSLDTPITSYVPRHSWATIAHKKGIPLRVISEGMGHNNELTTQIYLSSLDQSDIDNANVLVLNDI